VLLGVSVSSLAVAAIVWLATGRGASEASVTNER
jgi:hypothetical protein